MMMSAAGPSYRYVNRPDADDDDTAKVCISVDSMAFAVKLASLLQENGLAATLDDSAEPSYVIQVVCKVKDIPKVNFSSYLAYQWEQEIVHGTVQSGDS
jgi:hypothetical protein